MTQEGTESYFPVLTIEYNNEDISIVSINDSKSTRAYQILMFVDLFFLVCIIIFLLSVLLMNLKNVFRFGFGCDVGEQIYSHKEDPRNSLPIIRELRQD